jgi:hypothetical protein
MDRSHAGRAGIALAALLLTACSTIGHEKVEGWPELEIVEHYVPQAEMRDRCARYVGFGSLPIACAEFDFASARCDIWYSADTPVHGEVMRHERLHCAGYDHVGERVMQRLLARHLQARQAALPYRLTREIQR